MEIHQVSTIASRLRHYGILPATTKAIVTTTQSKVLTQD